MATAQQIADDIVDRVNSSKAPDFTAWRIGITQDVSDRYEYWDKPQYFLYWDADSLADAQDVESHFINQMGMQGGTGGNLDDDSPIYVYIF